MAGDPEHGTLDLVAGHRVALRRGAPRRSAATNAPPAADGPAPGADRWTNRSSPSRSSRTNRSANPRRAALPPGPRCASPRTPSGKKQVFVDWRGASWNFDPDADHGKDQDLSGSGLNVAVLELLARLSVVRERQTRHASPEPRNPAVLVRVPRHAARRQTPTIRPPPPDRRAPARRGQRRRRRGQPGRRVLRRRGRADVHAQIRRVAHPVRGTLTPGQAASTPAGPTGSSRRRRCCPRRSGRRRFTPSRTRRLPRERHRRQRRRRADPRLGQPRGGRARASEQGRREPRGMGGGGLAGDAAHDPGGHAAGVRFPDRAAAHRPATAKLRGAVQRGHGRPVELPLLRQGDGRGRRARRRAVVR